MKVGISIVAMAAVLGACGSSSPTATPPVKSLSGSALVLASVHTTAAAKTAKVSMSIGAGEKFALTADGAVDFSTGNTEMTMDLGGMLSSFLPGGLEVRAVNGVAYVKVPDSLGKFLGGSGDAKWFSMPTGKDGISSSPLAGAGQSDPTKFLAALENISDDVKEVGNETVRGAETKHYTATLNLGKAIDKSDVPPELRDKVKGLLEKNGKASTIPVDVWVDSDGYLRKMTMNLDPGTLGGFGRGATGATGAIPTISVSVEFYDFGTPVNVQAPPADQIISLKDFAKNGGGMFGGLSPAGLGAGSGSVTG